MINVCLLSLSLLLFYFSSVPSLFARKLNLTFCCCLFSVISDIDSSFDCFWLPDICDQRWTGIKYNTGQDFLDIQYSKTIYRTSDPWVWTWFCPTTIAERRTQPIYCDYNWFYIPVRILYDGNRVNNNNTYQYFP